MYVWIFLHSIFRTLIIIGETEGGIRDSGINFIILLSIYYFLHKLIKTLNKHVHLALFGYLNKILIIDE